MSNRNEHLGTRFSITPWDAEGVATIESTGSTAQEALEAGLRAVLTLLVSSDGAPENAGKSAPVNGEGPTLAALFADMVEALLEQVEFYGCGIQDVAVDGVLRREDGSYLSWGYVRGTLEPGARPGEELPRLIDAPTVSEEGGKSISIHAALHRPLHH